MPHVRRWVVSVLLIAICMVKYSIGRMVVATCVNVEGLMGVDGRVVVDGLGEH